MSKSKGNVISPDDIIQKYGTDALRGYEMFLGPPEQDSEWQISGISGVYRFLQKVWQLQNNLSENNKSIEVNKIIQQLIKNITSDIDAYSMNTYVSSLMILINSLEKKSVSKSNFKNILLLIAPIFPHLAEELWHINIDSNSIFESKWPAFDQRFLSEEKVTIAIQVQGKFKGTINVPSDSNQDIVQKEALKISNVKKSIKSAKLIKIIYIPGKIINFVLK